MTNSVVTYRVCDKCRKETVADATHKLTVDGHKFELDLCASHGQQLAAVLAVWTDVGTKVGEPTVFDRERALTNGQVKKALKSVHIPQPQKVDLELDRASSLFSTWQLTDHAKRRIVRCGFDECDVALAVVAPTNVEHSVAEGVWLHTRGKITVVTDPTTKSVITVLYSSSDDWATYHADQDAAEQLASSAR